MARIRHGKMKTHNKGGRHGGHRHTSNARPPRAISKPRGR